MWFQTSTSDQSASGFSFQIPKRLSHANFGVFALARESLRRSPATQQRAPESVMETRLLQVLRASGLPAPVVQYEVWDGGLFVARVDAAYPDARIAIEYDSDEFHSGRLATKRDRDRRHRLIGAGWLPIAALCVNVIARAPILAC